MSSCNLNDFTCGTGLSGGSIPKPGDPDNFGNITARGVVGGIQVRWTYPLVNPHAVAHVKVFRGTTSQVSDANELVTVNGNTYEDRIDGPLIKYYYWIQYVSVQGTEYEKIGPASATPFDKTEDFLNALYGRIDSGVLAKSLREQIDRLELIRPDLETEIKNRVLNDTALADAYNEVRIRADGARTLIENETMERITAQDAMIRSLNTLYASTAENGAMIQTERVARASENEALSSEITRLYAETASNSAGILQEAAARASDNEAFAGELTTLLARVNENAAAVLAESTARSTENEAMARDIVALYAGVDANEAMVTNEANVRAEADLAIATNLNALSTRTDNNEAWISDEAASRAAADSAMSSAIQSVVARLNATPMWVSSFELGNDFDRWKTSGGGSITAVTESYGGDYAGLVRHNGGGTPGASGSVYSAVPESIALNFAGKRIRVSGYVKRAPSNGASEFAVVYFTGTAGGSGWQRFPVTSDWQLFDFLYDVSPDNARGSDTLGIWGDTSGTNKGILIDLITIQQATSEEDLPAITAAIETESQARIDADSALAKQITTAQTEFGNNLASAQTTLSSQIKIVDGKVVDIGALYTAKVGVNGLVGGFGVYNDGKEIEAGFDVDRFWIGKQGSNRKNYPFIVDGNNIYLNGRVQFSRVEGAGTLASKNNLSYNEVTGTKPPTNADRTASNTAYDTSRVAGTWASTVRNNAVSGAAGAARVNSWTRPGTTSINGNRIWTGDAYVDTLQIKNRAVTITEYGQLNGRTIANQSTGDIGTKWVSHPGYAAGGTGCIILVNVVARALGGDSDFHCRIFRGGTFVGAVYSAVSTLTQTYFFSIYDAYPPANPAYRVNFHVTDAGGGNNAVTILGGGGITVIGGKR